MLEKIVQRQNKSLKRLAKTMNVKLQKVHDPPLKSNTEAMIDIIKQIKKVPVAEARAVIARDKRINPSRVIIPPASARDPISMRNPRNTRLGNTRLRSGSPFPGVVASPHSQTRPYQEGVTASASRQRRRTRDYGDGSREHYEGGSSSSSIRNGRHSNHMLFAPNPPFIQEDWNMRNRNQ
ncbi:hypothetical protein VI817_007886 [Penicillium citrinum]|nr:hypothetical protein VI817_007886 [Penicillium citrinum]